MKIGLLRFAEMVRTQMQTHRGRKVKEQNASFNDQLMVQNPNVQNANKQKSRHRKVQRKNKREKSKSGDQPEAII